MAAEEIEKVTLSITSGLMGAAVSVLSIWLKSKVSQKTEISPQPLVIKGAEEFVLKRDFEALVTKNEEVHKDLYDLDREHKGAETTRYSAIKEQLGRIEGGLELLCRRFK